MTNTPPAIVIGCSAGGMQALRTVLAGLDPALASPIIVVCHTGSQDVGLLCELLGAVSTLPVTEACERQQPQPGVVHVAPAGYHLLLEQGGHFALSVDARVAFSRPSIDVLFETAAQAYADRLIGVAMTGANSDGASGLKAIRAHAGLAIVQDPADAYAAAMPRAALEIAGADHCVALDAIAPLLNRLCLR